MNEPDYANGRETLDQLATRQREAFGYHVDPDGMPVWNTPEAPCDYTSDIYAAEQHAPEEL